MLRKLFAPVLLRRHYAIKHSANLAPNNKDIETKTYVLSAPFEHNEMAFSRWRPKPEIVVMQNRNFNIAFSYFKP